MEQLNVIKDKGYSISYGEKTKGTVSVAAPVFDLNKEPIAAISAECFEYDTDTEKLESIAKEVTRAAHLLSQELGHV